MLPIIGVVAAAGVIVKLIEHQEKLAEAARKAAQESQHLAVAEDDVEMSMQATNLKLEDQLAKLEGRPETNKLKIALKTTQIEADKLAEHFATQFQKMNKDVESGVGMLNKMWQALKNINSTPSIWDPTHAYREGTKEAVALEAAVLRVQTAQDDVNEAEENMHGAEGPKEKAAAAKLYTDSLVEQKKALQDELAAENAQASKPTEMISQTISKIHLTNDALLEQADLKRKQATQAKIDAAQAAKDAADEQEKGLALQAKGVEFMHKMYEELASAQKKDVGEAIADVIAASEAQDKAARKVYEDTVHQQEVTRQYIRELDQQRDAEDKLAAAKTSGALAAQMGGHAKEEEGQKKKLAQGLESQSQYSAAMIAITRQEEADELEALKQGIAAKQAAVNAAQAAMDAAGVKELPAAKLRFTEETAALQVELKQAGGYANKI